MGTHPADTAARESADSIDHALSLDPQFQAAYPDPQVAEHAAHPGLAASHAVDVVMTGYADRPALGQRATEIVTDDATGRRVATLLPSFDTVTYGEIWRRAGAVAAELQRTHEYSCRDGDFIALLGFASIDYTVLELACVRLGSVSVPLQTGASTAAQAAILDETAPTVLAAGVEYLGEAVDAVLAGHRPDRIVVFDFDPDVDDHVDAVRAATTRLGENDVTTIVQSLDDVITAGESLPPVELFVAPDGDDPIRSLNYTSGSTGTPKGVITTEKSQGLIWHSAARQPTIVLAYLPMSHGYGRSSVLSTLAAGGTVYFLAKRDMSTLFDDFALARPTHLNLVPRICELLHDRYLDEVDSSGDETAAASTLRNDILGGRVLSALTGSAPLAPELKDFVESALGIHVTVGYGASEMGSIAIDTVVQRPPVIDYKLIDVPELGYFHTDKPYPRGELIVKTEQLMTGYYKQPDVTASLIDDDGYYHSSDIMAEVAPDRLVYVDRRNNVLKLAQGEFVAISRLESLYVASPQIDQIYIYGTGERAYVLAVVVPSAELRRRLDAGADPSEVKAEIASAIRDLATAQRLNGYEIPRDFLVETTPFSQEGGLLSALGKLLRPRLKERYGQQLDDLYARLGAGKADEVRGLKTSGAQQPTPQTVTSAVRATLGVDAADVRLDSRFSDLGGDSLSALSLSNLLADVYGFEVPVSVIINPASDLANLVEFIDRQRGGGDGRATVGSVHGAGATTLHASDLSLDKFIDDETLSAAMDLPAASERPRTVLLTGATGHLGRGLAVEWLHRLAGTGGTLVCVSRGRDDADARKRIEDALSTDAGLLDTFRELAHDHLDVVAGDLSEAQLGLDDATWSRLAETVDLIVHPAAHVNHVLPYDQLFSANVVGTAELIKLAVTTRRKNVNYVSSMGVSTVADHMVTEDEDVRQTIPVADLGDGYGNGYSASKWAGEVLVHNAADACGIGVTVFRSGMILADQHYAGIINVPDIFTRLLYSLIVTGLAPATFYAADGSHGRPHASYGGVPVDALAAAIAAVGSVGAQGFRTFNTDPGYDDGISLDTIVDWMIGAGYHIERVDKHADWVDRFETAMRGLPDEQRQHSLLTVMAAYRTPNPTGGDELSSSRFRAAVREAGVELPHLSREFVEKNLRDLKTTGLL